VREYTSNLNPTANSKSIAEQMLLLQKQYKLSERARCLLKYFHEADMPDELFFEVYVILCHVYVTLCFTGIWAMRASALLRDHDIDIDCDIVHANAILITYNTYTGAGVLARGPGGGSSVVDLRGKTKNKAQ
jgi:hypothetical protein